MGLWVSCNITVSGIFLCEMMGWKWDCAISEHLGPFYQDRVPSWRVGTGKTCSGSSVMGPWSEGPWSVWPPVLDSCLVVGFSLPNPAAAAAAKSLHPVELHRRQPTRLPHPWDSGGLPLPSPWPNPDSLQMRKLRPGNWNNPLKDILAGLREESVSWPSFCGGTFQHTIGLLKSCGKKTHYLNYLI